MWLISMKLYGLCTFSFENDDDAAWIVNSLRIAMTLEDEISLR